MSATAKRLLDEAAARGLTLLKNGEKIVYVGPQEAMTDDLAASLRAHRAELLRVLPDESEKAAAAQAPRQPDAAQAPAGERSSTSNRDSNRDRTGRVLHTNYGTGYRHPDGRVETGTPEPTPRPVAGWPADLNDMLRRVATAFEWSQQDVTDFRQWARRSPEGLADARVFLQAEVAKLPKPSMADRRREVLDRLAADPDLNVAWTCDDSAGNDPVMLTLAIRGAGTCEMAIERAKFNQLELPQLIAKLADAQEAAP